MTKHVYTIQQAMALLRILHEHHVPYELIYKTSEHQLDGRVNEWTFVINSDKVLDALMSEVI
jgi:hypothetical protein